MKNIAIIVAGGIGSRVGMNIPKQFIEIEGKPILAYTIESFQNSTSIDEIEIVCISTYIDYLKQMINKYNFTKIKYIVNGGNCVQESIKNGLDNLKGKVNDEDIVIIHDGIRPVIDEFVIKDVIEVAKKYGAAATSLPYNEQIFIKYDDISTKEFIPRETIMRVSTPQAYNFKKLYEAYNKAFKENIGINGSNYTNTMWVKLGNLLYFSKGSDKNIKITTKDDIELFRAYISKKG